MILIGYRRSAGWDRTRRFGGAGCAPLRPHIGCGKHLFGAEPLIDDLTETELTTVPAARVFHVAV
jgi:hypothetical protein